MKISTFVWIRHGDKAFANGKGTPEFDPPITDLCGECRDETQIKIIKSINISRRNISPHLEEIKSIEGDFCNSRLFTSPFLRTRQTADILFPNHALNIDLGISEFLGHQKFRLKTNPSLIRTGFTPETIYCLGEEYALTLFDETLGDVKIRAKDSVDTMVSIINDHLEYTDEIIFYFSHGLFIECVAQLLKFQFGLRNKLDPPKSWGGFVFSHSSNGKSSLVPF